MNFVEASDKLYQEFMGGWNETTPVEYKNEKFTPKLGEPWVRFSVMESRARRAEVGRTRKRHYGSVMIEVFRPAFKKDAFQELVTDAESLLQLKFVDGIIIDASIIETIGKISGGSWFLEVVLIPFYYDEIIK